MSGRLAYSATILLLLLAAFAVRVYHLGAPSLWWDESTAVSFARRSLGEILLNTAEFHPPLYYAALHLWLRLAGDGEFALRFFSLIPSVLTVALVHRLGRRLFDPGAGLVAGLVVALSPLALAYGQEVRMYALETALALGSAMLAWRLLVQGAPERPRDGSGTGRQSEALPWMAYVAVTALSLYCDYFTGLVVLAENAFALGLVCVAILSRRAWRALALKWAGSQLGVAVLYLPWLLATVAGLRGYGGFRLQHLRLRSVLEQVWVGFNAGAAVDPEAVTPYLWVAAAILLLGLGLAVRQRYRRDSLAFVVLLCLVPVATFVAATRLRPFFHVRYLLVAAPAYYLLLGLAVRSLWWSYRPLGLLVIVPLAWIWWTGAAGYFFDPDFAKPDARGAAAFLEEVTGPGDLLFWPREHPLAYYYDGPATRKHFTGLPQDAPDRLTSLTQGYRRLFWESSELVDNDQWGVMPYLLEKQAALAGSRDFRGYRLVWYALPEAGGFTLGDLLPAGVRFEDGLALTGFGFGYPQGFSALPSDRRPWVVLQWQSLAPIHGPRKFFVHLVDSQGHIVGQADGPLLDEGAAPPQFWTVGTSAVTMANPVPVPALPPGRYRLEAGLYEAESGRQLGIVAGRTAAFILGELTVGRAEVSPAVESLGMGRRIDWTVGGVELLGLSVAPGPHSLAPGERLGLTLFWRAQKTPPAETEVRLWLEDWQGRVSGELRTAAVPGYPATRWQAGEVLRSLLDYRLDPEVEPGEYRLVLGLDERKVDITTVRVKPRKRSYALPAGVQVAGDRFANGIELAGFSLEGEPVRAGEVLTLTIYWRAGGASEVSWTVFTHLLDGGNHIQGQHDGVPAEGRSPTSGWASGEVVEDRHRLSVRAEASEGEYELEVGLYDARTGERLPLAGGGDRVVLGKVKVVR